MRKARRAWLACCVVAAMVRPSAALLLGAAMASCSDDERGELGGGGGGQTTTTESATTGGPDPFASCKKGELEADFAEDMPWAGPGVDPETGEVAPGSYRIATTYLALRPDKQERFGELSQPVVESLGTSQGLVAVKTGGSMACSSLRTYTLWESEEDMFAFVASPAHAAAMSYTSELSRGTSNTISWDGDVATATWAEATARLAAETTGDR